MSMYRVNSCVVGRGCLLWPVCSLGKTVSFCLASFYTPRPHLPVTPGYLLTSNFCIPVPYDEKDIFFFFFLVLVLEGLVGLQRIIPSSASSALVVGAQTWITVMLNGLPWKWTEFILLFLRLHPRTAFQTLLLNMMATPFLLRDSHPQ